MSDEWKSDRLEAEIKKQEMELLRKAHLKNLANAPAFEKIQYVLKISPDKEWTAEDVMEELTKLQIDNEVTLTEIAHELKRKDHR